MPVPESKHTVDISVLAITLETLPIARGSFQANAVVLAPGKMRSSKISFAGFTQEIVKRKWQACNAATYDRDDHSEQDFKVAPQQAFLAEASGDLDASKLKAPCTAANHA